MKLIRGPGEESGIYGVLQQDDGTQVAVTLEHAFLQDDDSYAPKLPDGSYTCVLGTHQLDHGGPFQAYEITGVSGHKGILFHVGNYNKDSDGCCLLGESRQGDMIVHSGVTFKSFMTLMDGVSTFQLDVSTEI